MSRGPLTRPMWHLIGITSALISALCWALGSVLYERLGARISPIGLNLSKSIVGVALFTAVLFVVSFEPMSTRTTIVLAVSGIIGIALGDTFFFLYLNDIGAHALVLLSLLGQVLTVFFAVFLLGETPSVLTWAGIIAVIAGVTLVLYSKISRADDRSTPRGVVYGILAVLCMSVGFTVTKVGIEAVSALQATWVRMVFGTAGIFTWALLSGRGRDWSLPAKDRRLARQVFFAVLVSSFGGFWLSHLAIKHLDLSVAGTLNATEPLFVLPLAAILLGEAITPVAVLGSLLTLAGVASIFFG
jgi:drug/metabolite transporter (DMT)-like permease